MIMPLRAVRSLPFLLVLLWTAACGNEVTMINAVLVDMEVKDLPRDVVQSVALHWPHARIESAQRRYGSDTLTGYLVTLGLEDGSKECPVLAKDGAVQWEAGSACHG
jgi:hypothetical protein